MANDVILDLTIQEKHPWARLHHGLTRTQDLEKISLPRVSSNTVGGGISQKGYQPSWQISNMARLKSSKALVQYCQSSPCKLTARDSYEGCMEWLWWNLCYQPWLSSTFFLCILRSSSSISSFIFQRKPWLSEAMLFSVIQAMFPRWADLCVAVWVETLHLVSPS